MSTPNNATNRATLNIVSLLPSATEIVCALGAQAQLVGVSHECDFPESVRNYPVLTSARIPPGGSTRSISTAVQSIVEDALSIFAVDERGLADQQPDVIITQDLCEVCAVSLDDVRSAVEQLAHQKDVQIVSLSPMSLGDVLDDIERVANAIGHPERGKALRDQLQNRMDRIARRASAAASRPRVATIEWLEPMMLGGTWMPELVELAGGEAVGAEAGKFAPTIEPDDLTALRPDVVLIKPCGFTLEQAMSEADLIKRTITNKVSPDARVYVTDGNAFFNRPGPRLVESLEIVAACTHPDLFQDFARTHERSIVQL